MIAVVNKPLVVNDKDDDGEKASQRSNDLRASPAGCPAGDRYIREVNGAITAMTEVDADRAPIG